MSSSQWQERKRLWEGKCFIHCVWDSFFPSSARMIGGQKVSTFFLRPDLKAGLYNENSPIKASGLPFSLAKAKTHPGGSSPELVQTPNLRWNEPHPLWTRFSPLIKRANHKTNLDVDTYRWVEFGRCRLGWEEHRGRHWVLLVGKLHYIIL